MNRAVGLLVARGWMNICAFGAFIVVGHFLAPKEFGFYAACSSVAFLFMTVVGAGFAEHVISRDHERRDEAAAFWCSSFAGLVGAVACALIGLSAKVWFGNSDVALLLYLLTPLPLLWGVCVIQEAVLIRDGRGTQIAGILVAAETTGIVLLLISLELGAGVYALAISRIGNSLVASAGYFAVSRIRLIAPATPGAIGQMVRFSAGVLSARLVSWVEGYGADLILVALLAPAGLGLFRMGSRLGGAASSMLFQAPLPAQQAYMGARVAHNPDQLGRAILRALRLHLAIATPIFVVIAVCATDLVQALLGSGWEATGAVLAALCAPAPLGVLTAVTSAALVARGLSRQYLYLQTTSAVVSTVALVAAAAGGVAMAAAGKALAGVALGGLSLFWLRELSGAQRRRLYVAAAEILAAGLVCALAAAAARAVTPRPEGVAEALARLCFIGGVGVATYAAALSFTARKAWLQLSFITKRALKRYVRIAPRVPSASVGQRAL